MKIYNFLYYHFKKLAILIIAKIQKFLIKYFFRSSNKLLNQLIARNREELINQTPFINHELYTKNNYGIQKRILKKINEPVDSSLFYSDIILYLCHRYFSKNLKYLEIGGSVLKNAILISEGTHRGSVTVFDKNEINPLKESIFLKSNTTSIRNYFMGSVLDIEDINSFNSKGYENFNFIFSDALHTSEGLMQEYNFIYGDKLQEKFIIYFDDLDFPELLETAKEIAKLIQQDHSNVQLITFKTFGWIGSHEPMHLNGIISNIDVFNSLKKDNVTLYRIKKVIF